MKIQKFLEKQPISVNQLWAKKFSDVHLPTEDRFSGTTLCGTPMLGNNYANVGVEEDRNVCPACLSHFKFENPFTQLCVWEGCLVLPSGISADSAQGKEKIQEFEVFMFTEFNSRVRYAEEIKTLPDIVNGKADPNTGGRNDLFFYCHSDDLGKFAVLRLNAGIRWWEDVLGNGGGVLYPDWVLEKYKNTWPETNPEEDEDA